MTIAVCSDGNNGRSTRGSDVWATVLMPILMGLDPNLSILMSGSARYCFSLLPAGASPVISVQRGFCRRGDCRDGL